MLYILDIAPPTINFIIAMVRDTTTETTGVEETKRRVRQEK